MDFTDEIMKGIWEMFRLTFVAAVRLVVLLITIVYHWLDNR